MIELDKRIISGKKPLTCFDAEQARNFVGKKCYLTNDISLFSDLDVFKDIEGCKSVPNEYDGIINTLSDIDTEISMVFGTTFLRWKFCIPCEWVEEKKEPKEPKYRPLTNTEFVDLFDSGKLRSIRLKDNSTERLERLIITDIYVQGDYLYAKLNSSDTGYGPAYFFSKCEYFDGKEWQPFGILDE